MLSETQGHSESYCGPSEMTASILHVLFSSVVPTRVKLNAFLGLFSDSDFMGHSDSLY